ncbi:MAG: phosphatase PAP2 family protein [Bacteroidales bacterium]|jgi:undecaprenyl-diphosphatase|nr:phosphatase PAP2 family protein [Bacteroidales bacterium]
MLEHFDQQLFLFLNSINSPFWDKVMFVISGKVIWAPLYLGILLYIGIKYKKKFFLILPFIILAVVLADQVSVQLFKNLFQRLRPCHEPSLERMVHLVNGECGGLYGFVSSHASNSFNVALISLLLIKKRWYTISIISWATIIGYSRIYLGVHYPGDVFFGSILGALIGWSLYKLYELTDRKFNVLSQPPVN